VISISTADGAHGDGGLAGPAGLAVTPGPGDEAAGLAGESAPSARGGLAGALVAGDPPPGRAEPAGAEVSGRRVLGHQPILA
jgi:hypothetical protein